MKDTTRNILIASGVVVTAGIGAYFLFKKLGKNKKFKNYEEVERSGMIGETLWKVISVSGKSKKYTDILPLDGGTVGIAHFAAGGLAELYKHMDTEKYFGKSQATMINNYSNACLPQEYRGKAKNDTGWGCYSKDWWKKGMTRFLNSSDSKKVQNKAWGEKMKPVIDYAISIGWNTKRKLAIAMGVSNSLGYSGFKTFARGLGNNPEETLTQYASKNAHRKERAEAINNTYPI